MRFVIIRHGQSTNNVIFEQTGGSVGRHADSPLTDLGHQQAARLADAVTDGVLPWTITELHCSLMSRAVQTAAPLAAALQLPLQGHLDVFETGGPFLEADDGVRTAHPGATAAELQSLSDQLVLPELTVTDGWYAGEYEDGPEPAATRARGVIAGLRERHAADAVVAVVTHGAFFQHLFRALLGIEQMTGWVLKHNTAISLFDDDPRNAGATTTATRIDWMPHLPAELISI